MNVHKLTFFDIVRVKTKNPLSSNIRQMRGANFIDGTFVGKCMVQYSDGSFTENVAVVVNKIKNIREVYRDGKWEKVTHEKL